MIHNLRKLYQNFVVLERNLISTLHLHSNQGVALTAMRVCKNHEVARLNSLNVESLETSVKLP